VSWWRGGGGEMFRKRILKCVYDWEEYIWVRCGVLDLGGLLGGKMGEDVIVSCRRIRFRTDLWDSPSSHTDVYIRLRRRNTYMFESAVVFWIPIGGLLEGKNHPLYRRPQLTNSVQENSHEQFFWPQSSQSPITTTLPTYLPTYLLANINLTKKPRFYPPIPTYRTLIMSTAS